MKKLTLYYLLVAIVLLNTGCEVVGGIFKAGMVWGILLVVIVLVTVIALIVRRR